MYVTWQTIITAASVISAIALIISKYNKGYDWVKRQNEQDQQIASIKDEMKGIKTEQAITTRGILACLKGLQELGANGPVTASVNEIENYLNEQAHKA